MPKVAPTPEDEEALSSIRAIMGLVQAGELPLPDATASRRTSILVRELAPLVPELMPGVLYTGACPLSGGSLIRSAAYMRFRCLGLRPACGWGIVWK